MHSLHRGSARGRASSDVPVLMGMVGSGYVTVASRAMAMISYAEYTRHQELGVFDAAAEGDKVCRFGGVEGGLICAQYHQDIIPAWGVWNCSQNSSSLIRHNETEPRLFQLLVKIT